MSAPPSLFDFCRSLLDLCVDTLTERARPVPERRYVADTVDSIAIDCEQLVAAVGQLFPGPIGDAPPSGVLDGRFAWGVNVAAEVARPAPWPLELTGDPPTVREIEASAEGIQSDAMALAVAASRFSQACQRVHNPTVAIVGPEGGFVRAVLVFQVVL